MMSTVDTETTDFRTNSPDCGSCIYNKLIFANQSMVATLRIDQIQARNCVYTKKQNNDCENLL